MAVAVAWTTVFMIAALNSKYELDAHQKCLHGRPWEAMYQFTVFYASNTGY